ncbi:MAG: ACP phosphodiesterase [Verrucomicrobiota bacterium]
MPSVPLCENSDGVFTQRMNFLAHLHLGPHTPEGMLGSLLGDFVRGRLDDPELTAKFTPAILESIRLHRAIDAFTDDNEHWKRSKYRLPEPLRRYAGIIVDVFYDHLLSVHYQQFANELLDDFIGVCHENLLSARPLADPRWHPFLEAMIGEKWLSGYAHLEGIGLTLDRISRRSPRVTPIAGTVAELEKNFGGYEKDFLTFYPEALAFARERS